MPETKQTFYLGTAVKITSIINIDTVTSAKITIKDAGDIAKVSSANMTKNANGIYSYIYQSASTDLEGNYLATITVVYDGYTSVTQEYFTLVEQE